MLLLSVADLAWTAEHPGTGTVKLAFEPELERAECECYSKGSFHPNSNFFGAEKNRNV
jgi:hypothetical protein